MLELGRRRPVDAKVYDILDLGPGFGSALSRSDLPLPAARILQAFEGADAVVVGTPVYKGSYTGLFKHFIDFVEPARLAGKPVALTAVGGGPRHALVVEHQLRPLFGFFTALALPTAVYAAETDLAREPGDAGYAIADPAVAGRLADAACQLADALARDAEAKHDADRLAAG